MESHIEIVNALKASMEIKEVRENAYSMKALPEYVLKQFTNSCNALYGGEEKVSEMASDVLIMHIIKRLVVSKLLETYKLDDEAYAILTFPFGGIQIEMFISKDSGGQLNGITY